VRSPRENNGLQYAKHENGLLYAKLERRNGLLYAKLVNGLLHARLVEGAADGLQPSPTTNSVTQGEQPATSEAEDERPMAYWPKYAKLKKRPAICEAQEETARYCGALYIAQPHFSHYGRNITEGTTAGQPGRHMPTEKDGKRRQKLLKPVAAHR